MAVPQTKWTLAEYLAWEETQPERNEFHRGEVLAMVGHGARMAAWFSTSAAVWRNNSMARHAKFLPRA